MAQDRQSTSNTLEIILPRNPADKEKIKVPIPAEILENNKFSNILSAKEIGSIE